MDVGCGCTYILGTEKQNVFTSMLGICISVFHSESIQTLSPSVPPPDPRPWPPHLGTQRMPRSMEAGTRGGGGEEEEDGKGRGRGRGRGGEGGGKEREGGWEVLNETDATLLS